MGAARGRGAGHAEWLALLLDREVTTRRQALPGPRPRRCLRHQASVEDVDFRAARGLDRGLFLKLAGCESIRARHGPLLTGATGVGKSWLACGLGHKACREESRSPTTAPPGCSPRARPGAWRRPLRQDAARPPARVDLLILDDWGPERLDDQQRRDLLEIVEDRHERRSTIDTSQLPVDRWYEIIGEPNVSRCLLR